MNSRMSGRLSGASETRQMLGALVTLASELNSTLDLDELLQTVMRQARKVMRVESCELLLLDKEKQLLVQALGERQLSFPLDRGIAGTVLASGEAYICNTPDTDRIFAETPDLYDVQRVDNVLCVPLQALDDCIGVLQVLNHENGRPFAEDDMYLFQAFADLAAVAIHNAQLHRDAVEHKRLEQEMNVAKDIQQNFLPTSFPQTPEIVFEATMEPAFHVGGDYYDIIKLKDGATCIVVGDVSGKGASAALYMASLHSELRVITDFLSDPKQIMSRLNNAAYTRSRNGAFISLLMIVIDSEGCSASLYSAGHPAPLLYLPADDKVTPAGQQNGFPLGVKPDQEYAETRITLSAGMRLLMYTDGVTEARDRAGTEFGTDRLAANFQKAARLGGQVIPAISRSLNAFTTGVPQYDDITMVVMRIED